MWKDLLSNMRLDVWIWIWLNKFKYEVTRCVPRNLIKLFCVPRSWVPQKEKMGMGIFKPSTTPYLSIWFTFKRKDGRLRFIEDMQLVNQVVLKKSSVRKMVDEFTEKEIYFAKDVHSSYDQFQLTIAFISTYIGLFICVLQHREQAILLHAWSIRCIKYSTISFLILVCLSSMIFLFKDEKKGQKKKR